MRVHAASSRPFNADRARPTPSGQNRRGTRERNSSREPGGGRRAAAAGTARTVSRPRRRRDNCIPVALTRNESPGSTCASGAARPPAPSLAGEAEDCDPRPHGSDRPGEAAKPRPARGRAAGAGHPRDPGRQVPGTLGTRFRGAFHSPRLGPGSAGSFSEYLLREHRVGPSAWKRPQSGARRPDTSSDGRASCCPSRYVTSLKSAASSLRSPPL